MDRTPGPDYRAGAFKPPHHGRTSPMPMHSYHGDENKGRQLQTRVSWKTSPEVLICKPQNVFQQI